MKDFEREIIRRLKDLPKDERDSEIMKILARLK